MRKLLYLLSCLSRVVALGAGGGPKTYDIVSPNGAITVHVNAGEHVDWSVVHKGQTVLEPSAIGLQLQHGGTLGENVEVVGVKRETVDASFRPVNYHKAMIVDHCTQLTLNCKGDYSIIFRVYDDAAAYRFVTRKKGELIVQNETANFNFTDDHKAFVPIQWDYRNGKNFNSSFEALYHELKLS